MCYQVDVFAVTDAMYLDGERIFADGPRCYDDSLIWKPLRNPCSLFVSGVNRRNQLTIPSTINFSVA